MHSFSRSLDTDKDLAYLIGSPQSIKNLCSHHLQRLSVHAGVSPRRKKEALGKIWGRLIIDKCLWIITCEHGEIKRIEKITKIREIVSTYYRVIITRLLQLLFTVQLHGCLGTILVLLVLLAWILSRVYCTTPISPHVRLRSEQRMQLSYVHPVLISGDCICYLPPPRDISWQYFPSVQIKKHSSVSHTTATSLLPPPPPHKQK